MITIRLQRTGRKGLAQFRVIVQDARFSPTSGKVVAQLGHYNPHTKELVIDKEQAQHYLSVGAQPSDRVARLLKTEGVKLPDWVKLSANTTRSIRNPEKLRKNRPAEPAAETEPAEATDATTEESTEAPADTEKSAE